MRGTFYGIGVGPGDPELLTVKAIKAIEAADVLIAPKTEKKEGSVALEIARPYLKDDIEIVYQVFPMVKDFAEDTGAWEANKAEILALLNAGKNVAFLTLGDPMFYSTYIYVFRLLEQASELPLHLQLFGILQRTVPADEVAPAFDDIDKALSLQLRVGLLHRVRVGRQLYRKRAHRRHLFIRQQDTLQNEMLVAFHYLLVDRPAVLIIQSDRHACFPPLRIIASCVYYHY